MNEGDVPRERTPDMADLLQANQLVRASLQALSCEPLRLCLCLEPCGATSLANQNGEDDQSSCTAKFRMRLRSSQLQKSHERPPYASRASNLRNQKRYRRNSSHISASRNRPDNKIHSISGVAFNSAFVLLSEEHFLHLYRSSSRLRTKRRASLFWLEGRAVATHS